MNERKDKIFISHSSEDIAIVENFVEQLLILGAGVPRNRIFCSSMEGHGVDGGEYIPDRLKDEINQSCVALLFISDNYKNSEVCLNELGAAWVTLDKRQVIPIILPGAGFDKLGFLDFARLAFKLDLRSDILKFISQNKQKINTDLNLVLLDKHLDEFLSELPPTDSSDEHRKVVSNVSPYHECFVLNLNPFNEIIRRAIPAKDTGIHKLVDQSLRRAILTDLNSEEFIKTMWYRHSGGDFYVQSLKELPSGRWLLGDGNWELEISSMWVSMNLEQQYDFILIRSESMAPFEIESDVGGESHTVGKMKDGTVVSINEYYNGYARISNRTVELIGENSAEMYRRDTLSRWIFLVTPFHKIGHNSDKTIEFCKRLDSGEVSVNSENIERFMYQLTNHPTVSIHR